MATTSSNPALAALIRRAHHITIPASHVGLLLGACDRICPTFARSSTMQDHLRAAVAKAANARGSKDLAFMLLAMKQLDTRGASIAMSTTLADVIPAAEDAFVRCGAGPAPPAPVAPQPPSAANAAPDAPTPVDGPFTTDGPLAIAESDSQWAEPGISSNFAQLASTYARRMGGATPLDVLTVVLDRWFALHGVAVAGSPHGSWVAARRSRPARLQKGPGTGAFDTDVAAVAPVEKIPFLFQEAPMVLTALHLATAPLPHSISSHHRRELESEAAAAREALRRRRATAPLPSDAAALKARYFAAFDVVAQRLGAGSFRPLNPTRALEALQAAVALGWLGAEVDLRRAASVPELSMRRATPTALADEEAMRVLARLRFIQRLADSATPADLTATQRAVRLETLRELRKAVAAVDTSLASDDGQAKDVTAACRKLTVFADAELATDTRQASGQRRSQRRSSAAAPHKSPREVLAVESLAVLHASAVVPALRALEKAEVSPDAKVAFFATWLQRYGKQHPTEDIDVPMLLRRVVRSVGADLSAAADTSTSGSAPRAADVRVHPAQAKALLHYVLQYLKENFLSTSEPYQSGSRVTEQDVVIIMQEVSYYPYSPHVAAAVRGMLRLILKPRPAAGTAGTATPPGGKRAVFEEPLIALGTLCRAVNALSRSHCGRQAGQHYAHEMKQGLRDDLLRAATRCVTDSGASTSRTEAGARDAAATASFTAALSAASARSTAAHSSAGGFSAESTKSSNPSAQRPSSFLTATAVVPSTTTVVPSGVHGAAGTSGREVLVAGHFLEMPQRRLVLRLASGLMRLGFTSEELGALLAVLPRTTGFNVGELALFVNSASHHHTALPLDVARSLVSKHRSAKVRPDRRAASTDSDATDADAASVSAKPPAEVHIGSARFYDTRAPDGTLCREHWVALKRVVEAAVKQHVEYASLDSDGRRAKVKDMMRGIHFHDHSDKWHPKGGSQASL